MNPSSGMDRYGVIGNPVEHSLSPAIHVHFAAITGQRLQYEKIRAPLDGFEATLRAFIATGARGCNVTVPFKFEAFRCAHTSSARARLAGAANTLVVTPEGGIHADNTDGAGLVADIERNAHFPIAGRDVLLMGAGGAAAGVLGPLVQAVPRNLCVANRTPARVRALADRHAALAAQCKVALNTQALGQVHGAFDIVINATASSLSGATIPVHHGVLRANALVLDMMYGPATHPFMAWARAHGAIARDGLGMLIEQAAEAFALWRGVRPPTAQVLEQLRLQCPAC